MHVLFLISTPEIGESKRIFDLASQNIPIAEKALGFQLEKVQGATRLGATGLRASERKSASERVSERTSENLSKISENLSKNSENL